MTKIPVRKCCSGTSRNGGIMEEKNVFRTYILDNECLSRRTNTDIRIALDSKGKLKLITFITRFLEDERRSKHWGSFLNEEWDFNKANESDLMSVFTEFALKSPEEFKKIYLIIKESDPVIFPIMKKSLETVKQMFDFE